MSVNSEQDDAIVARPIRELPDAKALSAASVVDPATESIERDSVSVVKTPTQIDGEDGQEVALPEIVVDRISNGIDHGAMGNGDAETASTADETPSFRAASVGSAADSTGSSISAVRAAQRSYLSPLRSKRYDGLRSSLLSPARSPSRTGYFSSHSRTSSMASMKHLTALNDAEATTDWKETIKWTRLRKISEHLYSESSKKAFGLPTCFAISGILAIGTSKGFLLIFDYQQVCKHVVGAGTDAALSGSVTSIALSADHTCVICGHENGSIFTWDLARPTSAAYAVPPIVKHATDKSGHLQGIRISFVCFIGARHSAFVSADCDGMVFCHTVNRKLLFQKVETTQILGRQAHLNEHVRIKPSATYNASVLPLGNVSDPTDEMGLVSILTPYKLAIISTLPVPRTQFKMNRPSGVVAAASTISGCAAWFPVMKNTEFTDRTSSVPPQRPRLAYAWCDQIYFLEVESALLPGPESESSRTAIPKTTIHLTSQYTCSESIVVLQWYSRSILCLVTQSSKVLVLNTINLSLIGQHDLLSKQIVHHDIYSQRLRSYFEARESEYVVQTFSDNYSHSFQTYKGKMFLLGTHDLWIGSLLTWTDKLLALISGGRHMESIALLMDYYTGSVELSGLRLPLVPNQRQAILRQKLLDTMLSSIRFSLASEDLSVRSDHYHERLLDVCFEACLLLDKLSFLVEDIYFEYEEVGRTEPFLNRLAIYVLDSRIDEIPPTVVQDLVRYFISEGLHTRLEDVLCHLTPSVMDINEVIRVCKQHRLYNALTYVYTEALHDFVGPFAEFIRLVDLVLEATQDVSGHSRAMQSLGVNTVNAVKVFSFLSLTLTGRVFPLSRARDPEYADFGRSEVLTLLFSNEGIVQPVLSSDLTGVHPGTTERSFPYLRSLLLFDCPTFLASMDEAFEDPYLNDSFEGQVSASSKSTPVTRQFIINILLDFMGTDFDQEDVLYLYMFIARNVPKYPQFIILSGSVLRKIIVGLCNFTDHELAEDCQLSVEYLLSIYKPADSASMLEQYRNAGFYRVLKTLYRSEQNWSKLLLAHLRDEDSELAVFDYISEVLAPTSRLTNTQRASVQRVLLEEIVAITSLDGSRAAEIIGQYAPELETEIISELLTRDGLLYIYLKKTMELYALANWITPQMREKYIDLLCIYDKDHLMQYLQTLDLNAIDVEKVLDNLEKYDSLDAVVHLMSAQGQRYEALQKVILELGNAQKQIRAGTGHPFEDIESGYHVFHKYTRVGVRLCEGLGLDESSQHKTSQGSELNRFELMWLELLTSSASFYTTSAYLWQEVSTFGPRRMQLLQSRLRTVVQEVLSRLLVSTYSHSSESTLHVLRMWFRHLSTGNSDYALLLPMLKDIFNSYQYYHQLLALAEHIIGTQMFSQFAKGVVSRGRGWKVELDTCSICSENVMGESLQFIARQAGAASRREMRMKERRAQTERRHGISHQSSGKQPMSKYRSSSTPLNALSNDVDHTLGQGNIISHACGHLTHEHCYKALSTTTELNGIRCPLCHNEVHVDLNHENGMTDIHMHEQLIPKSS